MPIWAWRMTEMVRKGGQPPTFGLPRDIWGAKRGLSVGLAVLMPEVAVADPVWDVFVARCLAPYEEVMAPVTQGLADGGGGVWTGNGIVMEVAEDTCAVRGGAPGDLAALLVRSQAYVPIGDGVWQSDLWREPRIDVETVADGYLVRETDLES